MIIPPIKSQGIKTKLVPWIQALMPDVNGRWLEPFFGTGVVAFNSGFKRVLVGDINPHIIRFYECIQSGLITPQSVRSYLEFEGGLLQKANYSGYSHFREVKRRFNKVFDSLDFLFLSRTSFNGMMRFNRKGEWNIPFCQNPNRFTRAYISKIVNQVHGVACVITPDWMFRVAPFEEIIALAKADDLIYCDPPYIGRYTDYYGSWSEQDERRLHLLLTSTSAKFILSTWHHNDYRANEYVKELWSDFNIVTHDHFYHSGGKLENRKSVVEALVFNFPAKLLDHNHGLKPRPVQIDLWQQRGQYSLSHVTD